MGPEQNADLEKTDVEGYRPFVLEELNSVSAPVEVEDSQAPDEAPGAPRESIDPQRLEEAQQGAEEILEAARKKAAEIESDAYEQGFSQGEKDGREIGSMKLDKTLERIEQICSDMESYHEEFVRMHEGELLNLISAIAGKVVGAKVELDDEIVKNSVMEALEAAGEWQDVTLRVDSSDLDFLEEMRPEFFEKINKLRSINIVSEPGLEKGGCIVSAEFGEVAPQMALALTRLGKQWWEFIGPGGFEN